MVSESLSELSGRAELLEEPAQRVFKAGGLVQELQGVLVQCSVQNM